MKDDRQEMFSKLNAKIADRYIKRDGSAPEVEPLWIIAFEARQASQAGNVATVAAFLAHHDPDEMWGGHRAAEALRAFARLVQIPATELMKLTEIGGDLTWTE